MYTFWSLCNMRIFSKGHHNFFLNRLKMPMEDISMEITPTNTDDLEKKICAGKEIQTKTVLVLCEKCKRVWKAKLEVSMLQDIKNYPFPIVMMHTDPVNTGKMHLLIAYIDMHLKCRHVDYLHGNQVFITPFIVYNPHLLRVFCNK